MSKDIYLVVEGPTEQIFVDRVLTPYCANFGVYMHATLIPKKGQNGGDVRFERAKVRLGNFLKQRNDTLVGTFFDYYGLKSWPKLDYVRSTPNLSPCEIAKRLNAAAREDLIAEFPTLDVANRFIPFLAVHEFEALLFSDENLLADAVGVSPEEVVSIVKSCGSPEEINNSPETAPSKRLDRLSEGRFGKTTTGIALAEKIGVEKMRNACPNFNMWLEMLEKRGSCTPTHNSN